MTRPISMRRALGALTLGAWVLLAASAASEADSIADFYRGKVVKVVIGFDLRRL